MVCYAMLYSGIAWSGMVWYVMVWYSVVWCVMVCNGVVCYDMVWYGMVYGVVQYGIWCGIGMVWCGMVWYDMVWHGTSTPCFMSTTCFSVFSKLNFFSYRVMHYLDHVSVYLLRHLLNTTHTYPFIFSGWCLVVYLR